MALLTDVTLITDFDHLLACVPETAFDGGKGEHEGAEDDHGLNSDDDVEGDDCFFHGGVWVVHELLAQSVIPSMNGF